MIDPYFWAALGAFFSIGFSVMGSSWGIYMTGSSLMGNAVKHPRITSKNLIRFVLSYLYAMHYYYYFILHSAFFSVKLLLSTVSF